MYPRDSWRTVIHKDLRALRVELEWYRLAQDRLAWRQLITYLAGTLFLPSKRVT